jgi:XRE family aerobic/anaerobic benzoate catabolism transcriptional regulator
LEGRAAFYSKADLAFNTSAQGLEDSVERLRREVRPLLGMPV